MSQTEIGELFVGAYLRIIKQCPIVQYNVHDSRVGGQGEIDVIGIDHVYKKLYVCEVATHLDGAHYPKTINGKNFDGTLRVFEAKLKHAREFATAGFTDFAEPLFVLWCPYVATGAKTEALTAMAENWPGPGRLELRINASYTAAMRELIDRAATETKQRGEEFYRTLQLLTHLRTPANRRAAVKIE